MTAKELLAAARRRIDNPNAWVKDSVAADGYGGQCHPDSDDACQWCAIGAVWAASRAAAGGCPV